MTMSMSFDVDFSGWSVPLGEARVRTSNLRPALDEVGDIVEGIVRRNIEDGGGVEHWPELAPSTLLNRARYPQGPGTGARQVFKGRANVGPSSRNESRVLEHSESASAHFARTSLGIGRGRSVTAAARRVLESAKPLIWTRELIRTITHVVGGDYVDTGSPLVKSWTLFLGSRPGKSPKVPARNPFGFTRADEFSIMGAFVRHIFGGITRGLYS